MKLRNLLIASVLVSSVFAADVVKNVEWPTFNGDFSGRRFSALSQIDATNVRSLTLTWTSKPENPSESAGASVKATPVVKDGVLYYAVPDNARAIDARTGRELWHYEWQSHGGIHIGNRGIGIYGNWVFF